MPDALALVPTQRLTELEGVIERGLDTFVDVGRALLEIRDERLYRDGYSNFEAYCEGRWQFSRPRAYQLIDAAQVATALSTTVDTPPANEAQARELAPLMRDDEQAVVEVWRDLREAHGDRVTAELVRKAVSRRLRQDKAQPIQSSESNEWYTPREYIDAARAVLGRIELDPASHPIANGIVNAERFYAIDSNGLTQPWTGTIWLNPPYGPLVPAFVQRAVDAHAAGEVTAAIILVNSHATDTAWFQPLWDYPLCFTDHRIDFYSSDTLAPTSGSTHGSVFAYLGPDVPLFASTFQHFGAVVRRLA